MAFTSNYLNYGPDVRPSRGPIVTAQEDDPHLIDQRREEVENHLLLNWTGIRPGDVVSLRVPETPDCVGTVETGTNDGLIIWIRNDLNERRLFHFRDCESARLTKIITGKPYLPESESKP